MRLTIPTVITLFRIMMIPVMVLLFYSQHRLSNIFATRLPAVNRALIRHLETIQRDYMWDFVANHWEQFGDTSDHTSLA